MTAQPTIVWITLDSLKATALPMYGNAFACTPNLSRLAAEGVTFSNAFAQMPKCIPSRTSMISGRYPHSDGLRVNRGRLGYDYGSQDTGLRRDDEYNLVSFLKGKGYHTGLKGPNHMLTAERHRQQFDSRMERGVAQQPPLPDPFDPILHRMQFPGNIPDGYDMESYPDANATRQFQAFLREAKGKPSFGFLDLRVTHPWYWHIPPFRDLYRDMPIPVPPKAEFAIAPFTDQIYRRVYDLENVPPEVWRNLIRAYYSMASYGDMLVGRVLDELDKLGLAEDTIVVFSADHGDFAAEHGCVEKHDTFLYDCLTHLPLIIRCPKTISAGSRFEGLAEFVDIAPTLMELAGFDIPDWVQGQSAVTAMVSGTEYRQSVISHGGLERVAIDRTFEADKAAILEKKFSAHHGQYLIKQHAIMEHPDFFMRAKMIRTKTHKYIHRLNGHHEFYDLRDDPHEIRNEIANPAVAFDVAGLRELLLSRLIESETNLPLVDFAWA